jgi:predicted nucleic acid-binding protein
MPVPVIIDTNVLVAALLRGGAGARGVVRACLQGHYRPLVGAALMAEYDA